MDNVVILEELLTTSQSILNNQLIFLNYGQYIVGFLLFFVVVILCYFVYKFFNIFF